MDRKPNKHLDDLLNLLCTIEADNFRRHKTNTVYPPKQKINVSQYEEGIKVQGSHLKVIVENKE